MIALFSSAFAQAPAPAAPAAPSVPALSVEALKERLFGAADRTRLVNFWATWCGPCIAEIPALVAFAKARPDVEVVLVNVDLPQLHDGKVVPFVAERAPSGVTHYSFAVDPQANLRRVVPDFPEILPYTLVVDDGGAIVNKFYGAMSASQLASVP